MDQQEQELEQELELERIFKWLDEEDAFISCLFWEKFGKGLPRPSGYSERVHHDMMNTRREKL
jgi:hypothetical protein